MLTGTGCRCRLFRFFLQAPLIPMTLILDTAVDGSEIPLTTTWDGAKTL